MSTFAPIALPHVAPPDPSKHVNFQPGMVLGVDDFQAEFTYLADRTRRVVRDLIGYGVVSGLHVTLGSETDARGPRLQVSPGGLVTPSGQLVCISPAQCAYLDEWLAANRQAIDAISSPAPPGIDLAIVACYRQCETDDVPIPGEPCRSEDELMKPSRIQDSFALELRFDAPPQAEDDAVREVVAWIRQIPVVDEPVERAQFVADLELATTELDGSPADPLAFLASPPPASLRIPRDRLSEFTETLFAFWVTRLRARARSGDHVAECGCCGEAGVLDPGADCLRIATVGVPVALDAITGEFVVDTGTPITIDESMRPNLLHLRMLQEWLLTIPAPAAAPVPPPDPDPDPDPEPGPDPEALVVSGLVLPDGTVNAAVGELQALAIEKTLFLLTYPGFDKALLQLVSGQPLSLLGDKQTTFEVIAANDPDLPKLLANLPEQPPPEGIVVRVRDSNGNPVESGFTVRIEPKGKL